MAEGTDPGSSEPLAPAMTRQDVEQVLGTVRAGLQPYIGAELGREPLSTMLDLQHQCGLVYKALARADADEDPAFLERAAKSARGIADAFQRLEATLKQENA